MTSTDELVMGIMDTQKLTRFRHILSANIPVQPRSAKTSEATEDAEGKKMFHHCCTKLVIFLCLFLFGPFVCCGDKPNFRVDFGGVFSKSSFDEVSSDSTEIEPLFGLSYSWSRFSVKISISSNRYKSDRIVDSSLSSFSSTGTDLVIDLEESYKEIKEISKNDIDIKLSYSMISNFSIFLGYRKLDYDLRVNQGDITLSRLVTEDGQTTVDQILVERRKMFNFSSNFSGLLAGVTYHYVFHNPKNELLFNASFGLLNGNYSLPDFRPIVEYIDDFYLDRIEERIRDFSLKESRDISFSIYYDYRINDRFIFWTGARLHKFEGDSGGYFLKLDSEEFIVNISYLF